VEVHPGHFTSVSEKPVLIEQEGGYAAQPDTRLSVWRRETSLPGRELELLGHPASSLFTVPSRVLRFLLVYLSRIQDYVWFWYFLSKNH
jgi:hypothetical protein